MAELKEAPGNRNQYFNNYYHANKDSIAMSRFVNRLSKGIVPMYSSLQRFGLTIDNLNTIRKDNGFPPIDLKTSPRLRSKVVIDSLNTAPSLDRIIEDIKKVTTISEKTKISYIKKLNVLYRILGCDADDMGKCMLSPSTVRDRVFSHSENPNTRKDYFSTVISAAKYSEPLRDALNDVIDEYRTILQEIMGKSDEHNNKKTEEVAIPWKTFTDREKQLTKQSPTSDDSILARLYTKFPLRDDFKNLKITDERVSKLDTDENWYHVSGKIIINKYKTDQHYDPIVLTVPKKLKDDINQSLMDRPREYLFVNRNGEPYVSMSDIVKDVFGYRINDIRHSYVTNELLGKQNMSVANREQLSKTLAHSTQMQLGYLRRLA